VELPRPSDGHPVVDDLAALVDGDLSAADAQAVSGHLGGCAACRAIFERVGSPIDLPSSEDPVDRYTFVPLSPMPVTGEPVVGDLWQLDWEDDALVAVVVDVADDRFVAAPVTTEPPVKPTSAARVDLVEPDAIVWAWPATAEVTLGVFSYPVGTASAGDVDAVRTGMRETSDRTLLEDLAVGGLDLLRRADLVATVTALAAAQWVPDAPEEALSVRDLMAERRLLPSQVAERTGLPASVITELARGVRHANDAEAAALADVLDAPAARLRGHVSLPAALVRAVERPVHRVAIRARAIAAGTTEAIARLIVAEAVYARPARTAGDTARDVDAWSELVAHHLDA
jgi:hypothetical protein